MKLNLAKELAALVQLRVGRLPQRAATWCDPSPR